MIDKIISKISENYAKALFETAVKNNDVDIIAKQMSEVLAMISQSNDLNIVLSNTSISSAKKNEIMETLLNNKIKKELLNFIKILIDKNRINNLDEIYNCYINISDKLENKKNVEIISPVELNFENKSNILFKLEHKLKSEIKPIWTIDKDLIAGLVFKFDDYVIDTSVRTKLKNLSKK